MGGSEIKRPSLKGMQNTGHLGHFAQDKFIQQGHNDLTDPMAVSPPGEVVNSTAPVVPVSDPSKLVGLEKMAVRKKALRGVQGGGIAASEMKPRTNHKRG